MKKVLTVITLSGILVGVGLSIRWQSMLSLLRSSYDLNGQLVGIIDVGHETAAV